MTTAAAIGFCILLIPLAVFQVALVAGAPIGRFAWGGQHRVLPQRLRIGSVVAIALYVVFGFIALERTGITSVLALDGIVMIAAWVLFAYLALGVLMNSISRSKPERYTMTPLTLVLAVLALIIAIG